MGIEEEGSEMGWMWRCRVDSSAGMHAQKFGLIFLPTDKWQRGRWRPNRRSSAILKVYTKAEVRVELSARPYFPKSERITTFSPVLRIQTSSCTKTGYISTIKSSNGQLSLAKCQRF